MGMPGDLGARWVSRPAKGGSQGRPGHPAVSTAGRGAPPSCGDTPRDSRTHHGLILPEGGGLGCLGTADTLLLWAGLSSGVYLLSGLARPQASVVNSFSACADVLQGALGGRPGC